MDSHPRATLAYAGPFVAYVALMAIERTAALPPQVFLPARCVAVAALILLVSRPYLDLRPAHPIGSILLGVAVFAIWIGPDVLFGYRHFWLFENSVTGRAASSLDPALRSNPAFLSIRAAASFLLVPVLEELFWRGWLMRWLIQKDFLKVEFGSYEPLSFWAVAILFASEHGPYWEVGLAAGMLYNWWAVRGKNLADCILAHAVTNAILSGYVLVRGKWEYWL